MGELGAIESCLARYALLFTYLVIISGKVTFGNFPCFVVVSFLLSFLACFSVQAGCIDYLFFRKRGFYIISILYGIIDALEKDVDRK